jgi:hypothetical protein
VLAASEDCSTGLRGRSPNAADDLRPWAHISSSCASIGGASGGGSNAMKYFPIAALVLAIISTKADGQAQVGRIQPDRIMFGKVHVGAMVEASFQVYAAPGAAADAKLEVTAPPFVRVLRKETDVFNAGRAGLLRGAVEFALDTTKVAEFTGDVAVQLNATSVRVPVSASVRPQRAGLLRLLVVETPFQRFSTSDGGHFRQWTDLVAAAPWDVSYLLANRNQPVLRDLKLSDYGAVLLGPEGVFGMTPADLKRLRAYVEDGGSVLVMANCFFQGTVAKANTLLEPYGVVVADEETRGGNGQVTIEKDGIDPRLVNAGIERVTFFRASPSAVTNPTLAKVLVRAAQVGNHGDGFVTTAKAGYGQITVFGQSLWWDWVSSARDPYGSNVKLLRWVLTSAHERRERFLGLTTQPLTAAQLATSWAALAADDVDVAAEARQWLTRAPGADRQTVPFLKGRLSPDQPANVDQLERLMAQLDDKSFQTREKAQRALEDLDDAAWATLKRALDAAPSAEVRRRVEGILNKDRLLSPERRQRLRAVDVLEKLATPEAKELLRRLSEGAPGTRVTVAGRAALDRLSSVPDPKANPGMRPNKRP